MPGVVTSSIQVAGFNPSATLGTPSMLYIQPTQGQPLCAACASVKSLLHAEAQVLGCYRQQMW